MVGGGEEAFPLVVGGGVAEAFGAGPSFSDGGSKGADSGGGASAGAAEDEWADDGDS